MGESFIVRRGGGSSKLFAAIGVEYPADSTCTCTGESSNPGWMPATAKLNGEGYNVSLRASSNGNITLYRAASYTIPAGNYLLVLGLAD